MNKIPADRATEIQTQIIFTVFFNKIFCVIFAKGML
jgi:hypothetical protein